MSATATGQGRLLAWERFAVGLRTSVIGGVGSWDADGNWHEYSRDYAEVDWRSEVWTIIGLGRRLSLYGRLPWIVGYRRAGNLGDNVSANLADVQAGARFQLLDIGEYRWLPALALTFATTFPTGRTVDAADIGGSGVTSRGAWVFSFGAIVEKTYMPWFVRLAAGVSVPLARERPDLGVSQRFGVGLQLALVGGVELVERLVLSLVTRLTYEDAIRRDGAVVPNSTRTDFGFGPALSWRFDPHWTLQAGLDTGLFVSGLGDNTSGRVTGVLGARYGFF
ncbi:MAG: hypothetical protein KC503_21380 [Myxococcales bacterium]|nr:hypothetical protein [Myxococcales bacterium]